MGEPWQNQAQKKPAADARPGSLGNGDQDSMCRQAAEIYIGHRSAIGATDPPVWIQNDEHDAARLVFVTSGRLCVCSNPGGSNSVVTQLDLELGPVGFLPGTGLQLSVDPNGEWLAWVTDECYTFDVRGPTAALATRSARRITDMGCRIESYSWSPDCSKLIVSANRLGHFQLWIVETSCGSCRRLTSETTGTVDINPTFTFDGSAVVFARLDTSWTHHTIMMLTLEGAEGASPIIIGHHYSWG